MKQNESEVRLRRQYRQILLGSVVRNADNLSNELTGSILGDCNRMRIAVSVCQLVEFSLPQFPPTAEKSHEYAGLRKSASQHFAG
jgi:hypothetical protein